MHGGFYQIRPSTTSISNEDLAKVEGEGTKNACKGGFRYAKNLRSTVYGAPRPLEGHGEHRYFYQLIAVGKRADGKKEDEGLSAVAKYGELLGMCEGRVLGWGDWIGVAIRN